MDFLLNIGQTQLNALPVIDNGGLLSYILDLIKIDGIKIDLSKISNITNILNHVAELMFNSTLYIPVRNGNKYNFNDLQMVDNTNYSNIIIGLIIWLILLIIILLIWIITSCCFINREHNKFRLNYHFIFLKTYKPIRIRAKTLRWIKYISFAFVIICGLIWICLLIFLCLSLTLMNHSIETTNENNKSITNNSNSNYETNVTQVSNGFSDILKYLHQFEIALSSETTDIMNKSVKPISVEVNTKMEQSIWYFGNRVLSTFNVTTLIEEAKLLTDGIKILLKNAEIIRIDSKSTFAQINQIKGGLIVERAIILNNLDNICPKLVLNIELYNNCIDMKIESQKLETKINTSIIITSPGAVLDFVINSFAVNITEIILQFDSVNKTLYTQLEPQIKSIIQQVEVSKYISLIPQIWNNLMKSIVPFIKNSSSLTNQLDEYLLMYQSIQNITFAIILIIIFIFILILIFLLYIPITFLNRANSLIMVFNSAFVILILLICFITSIISSLFIILPIFLNSQACVPLNTTTNRLIIDQKINEKLSNNWKKIVDSLGINSDSNEIKINLDVPKDILDVLLNGCRNEKQDGLLKLFGISDNLVNVTDILEGPAVAPMLKSSKNESFKAFMAVNPKKVIPTDQLAFVNDIKTLLQYFDNINYSTSIKELSKPLVGLTNLTKYILDMRTFVKKVEVSTSSNENLAQLSNNIDKLETKKPNYDKIQLDIDRLRTKFEELQNTRNLENRVKNLMLSIDSLLLTFSKNESELYVIFSQLYDEDIQVNMLQSVEIMLSSSLKRLFASIIQCDDVPKLYDATMTTFCNTNHGFVTVVMTMGVLIISTTVVTVILSVSVGSISLFFFLYSENISKA